MNHELPNALDGLCLPIPDCDSWQFPEGSRFGDLRLWWGQGRLRNHPHEGVDCIAPGLNSGRPTTIQAIASGVIVAQSKDFLGHTLWLRHPLAEPTTGHLLHSVYGHLQPHPDLKVGQELAAGTGLGTVTFGQLVGTVPAHLHFSLAWLATSISPTELHWKTIHLAAPGCFFDPLPWLQIQGCY